MDGQTVLDFLCSNATIIGPILAVVFPASLISGFAHLMPPWLSNVVHFLAFNWVYMARKIAAPKPGNL